MNQYKVGITFGAFDPLHYGHIRLIQRAFLRCDKLIVCLSDKEYINVKKKRDERVPFVYRMQALKELRSVYQVGTQSLNFGKKQAIKKYKPDVIFVGTDWTPKTFEGEGLGIPVVYLPRTEGISSTELTQIV